MAYEQKESPRPTRFRGLQLGGKGQKRHVEQRDLKELVGNLGRDALTVNAITFSRKVQPLLGTAMLEI